ncbi:MULTISPECIES: DUF4178 domain-containing protein [unclassified Burkholderia]|uniref:DUF4178 domain-containing protein n=1 Tax=unclassified Burkholderia TaxID=2613784 RepID=UPI00141FC147|nr:MULTISPECIES: DUF4178 domain-containing protein [unclassified Burkholderia]NIE88838.1 DUF4178 domain-containing protein [Burkholderia sp. Tr-860]NIF68058.1 DUF4178 domain-containing protein [Burkholderia sp. Cy-647]NIF93557.1 DUF4178 domain-containing protein [Burkholderia sp. Cy-637]NIF99388.1 DUF4178 domain-containing protein [Burkholderia sp. Ax-1720]
MFNTTCPQCGAPVEMRSPAAVMAVCGFCRSTLLRRGEAVERIGELAAVLDDDSLLQIGAAGRFGERAFTLLGRIRLDYEAGFWSEWYVAFDDGGFGWLSEASGQYTVTVRQDEALPGGAWPAFSSLAPGQPQELAGRRYLVSDLRTARCTGGEGELPFRVDAGWAARVADLRSGSAFATLDYAEAERNGGRPELYVGEALELDRLALTGLRDPERVAATAAPKGEMIAFACPSCGASQSYVPGLADYVVCSSCHAGIHCTPEQQIVFSKARKLAEQEGALPLGASGVFDGLSYTVIGMLRCRVPGDEESWDEYLLMHPRRGFLWLVHSDAGWERVSVLDNWPAIEDEDAVSLDGKRYRQRERYRSEITYVVGAFNWQARVGDITEIADYSWQRNKLTLETSPNELVWSRASRLTAAKLAERFKLPSLAASVPGAAAQRQQRAAQGTGKSSFAPLPMIFSVILCVVNLPVLLAFDAGMVVVILGVVMLWVPEWIWRAFAGNGGGQR